METALITGGAGFIGSHLVRRLLQDGFRVVVVDNFLSGSKQNIDDLLDEKTFRFIDADVVSFDEKELTDEQFSFVFHLASPASPNANSPKSYIAYPLETLRINSQGTDMMLALAVKHNARFLYTSSSEVYGDPTMTPQPESYFGNVNPVGVRSVYDEGKRFGEAITMAYIRKFGLDARIIRIFNTFGPNMQKDDGRVVSNFINQALAGDPMTIYGDGSQTRSFCYVSDMVEGLYQAMMQQGTKGEVFNLGNPDERTIGQMAELIRKMTESSSEIVKKQLPEDDPKRRKPDISKAREILSWEPKVSIEEGLQKTISYFRT